jgi:glyceraldehyde 3-phosphate dehydrogenase
VREAAEGKLKGILKYCTEPLVSVDFTGDSHSSIFDSMFTRTLDDNLAKILSWYDNEWGYSCRVVDLVQYIGERM